MRDEVSRTRDEDNRGTINNMCVGSSDEHRRRVIVNTTVVLTTVIRY